MEYLSLFPAKEEISKDKKIKALDELFKKSLSYKTSENYYQLLKFIERFPALSPFNAFLVYTQNPGVQAVMTEHKWMKYGRKVIPFARPMVILVPFGPVDFVYDIKDTEGEAAFDELTNPFATKGTFDKFIYYRTIKSCNKENILIDEKEIANAAAGYVRKKKTHFDITINSTWDINVKYSTLIHELGHIYCGHLGTLSHCWWRDRSTTETEIQEIEAESISYLVCMRAGLETTSEQYISDYIKNRKEMPALSLDTVLIVAGYLELMAYSNFRPKKTIK